METLNLLKQLIACPSITPNDAGCQDVIEQRLLRAGFQIEKMLFGNVKNVWATYGNEVPLFVFAGHTDVVPPGPEEAWDTPPFEAHEREENLYGRGAADMKSGLAAMIVAAEQFIHEHPHFKGSIAFLITSDEEGATNLNGTKKVIETLTQRGVKIDYCIVGEASSEHQLGDQIRVGRRGSLSGHLEIDGKQGHVAFPHKADNAIHKAIPFLNELINIEWDKGNEFFPPTTFQVSNINAGTGALNVIPGKITIEFNFRFSTELSPESIQANVVSLLEKHNLTFNLQWNLSGLPFLTRKGKLLESVQKSIKEETGLVCDCSTGGGTSDGRFIAPTGAEVIELGPINASVHQVNEHIRIADLPALTRLYALILDKIFTKNVQT